MPKRVPNDPADAALVADVAAALRRWKTTTGQHPPSKVLREAVWFFWQQPRLTGPLVHQKYPRGALWSGEAARAVAGGKTSGRLVIEHVEPMNRVLSWLMGADHPVKAIADELGRRLSVVVVTNEESKRLPDAGTPAERYAAAGLDLDGFRTLDEWSQP